VTLTDQPRPKKIETIARGVVVTASCVLLCRDRKGGYTYLPGGHVEPGESASDALARELEEEAGFSGVRVGPCALVTEQRFTQGQKARHEINLVFHVEHALTKSGDRIGSAACEPTKVNDSPPPPPVESLEDHIEFVWVEPAAIPELDLRPASMKAWLMSGNAGLDRPAWVSQSEW
jgi:8-oxo-dGTP diphosphatase